MTKKCPYGNHYHHTLRSARRCHRRGFNLDVDFLILKTLEMGLEMAIQHERYKARRSTATRRENKKREMIMEEKKMYKLRIDGIGHASSGMLLIFGASDAQTLQFLKDLEKLVLRIHQGP